MTRLLWTAVLGAFLLGCSSETANDQDTSKQDVVSKPKDPKPTQKGDGEGKDGNQQPAAKRELTLTYFTMKG